MRKIINKISEKDMKRCEKIINTLNNYFSNVIVGQDNLCKALIITIMVNGHILLVSVPGLAKTTAAKVITNAFDATFSRIQCTPDLIPSDIIGTQIFNYSNSNFETKIGPIYANFVLLDEINRTSAKTQSATLEAMQERQITIDSNVIKLPNVFTVIATQNPIEHEGTYLLSEAQLDRFVINERLQYPTPSEEMEILDRYENDIFYNHKSILKLSDVEFLQKMTKRIYVDDSIKNYICQIINATRNSDEFIDEKYANYINLGASTRGTIAFLICSKALALINGRDYVIPDDIISLRYLVLRHRISLHFSAKVDNISVENIIDLIFGAVQRP